MGTKMGTFDCCTTNSEPHFPIIKDSNEHVCTVTISWSLVVSKMSIRKCPFLLDCPYKSRLRAYGVLRGKHMVKIDPHGHEPSYRRWKERGMSLEGLTEANAVMIRRYLEDMEIGANVNPGSKRGARSYGRLRNLKSKLHTLAMILQTEMGMNSWGELEFQERNLLLAIKRMREGTVLGRKNRKEPILAVGTYVKVLKAFWHWYMRASRRDGRDVRDTTIDLDGRDMKPKFNYFTVDDLKQICDVAKQEYRVLMMFLFDSGIRAPTELMNVRVSDLEWNAKTSTYTLSIREETSKTFGRKIKLLLCSELLHSYLRLSGLGANEYIFTTTPQRVNQYIKRLAFAVLKIGTKIGEGEYDIKDGLTLYDFRHSSACYWLPRYKIESALKYRFGWKKSDMIHYYTELLGMKDTIQEEDLYIDVTKTELEQQITDKGKEIELLQEQLTEQNNKMHEQTTKMEEIADLLKALNLERMLAQKPKLLDELRDNA